MLPQRHGRGRATSRWRAWVRRRRRVLGVLALAVAAGLAVHAVSGSSADGTEVLVLARDLPAGHHLTGRELTTARWPADAVPDGALRTADAVDRVLAGAGRRGEPLTDARLVGPGQLTSAPTGTVAVPVTLTDPAPAGLVRAGDTVAVLGGGVGGDGLDPAGGEPARVLVAEAVVLRTPGAASTGFLGDGQRDTAVVLAMGTDDALRVADAHGRRWLGLALLPGPTG